MTLSMYPFSERQRASPRLTASEVDPAKYRDRFIDFINDNPTVFHAVDHYARRLAHHGFKELSERDRWDDISEGGMYFVRRNGSSLIAFVVGEDYELGNGAAIIAGHVDALTAKLKPVSKLDTKAGYVQLGVAPYAGGMNRTWWDRDLGIGGRVLVKDLTTHHVKTHLLNLNRPIARIPTLAPHFGRPSLGPFNKETQTVPIIGLDSTDRSKKGSTSIDSAQTCSKPSMGQFTSTQPERLVKCIERELEIDNQNILSWELELFDVQPATVGGLDDDFIFAGRIDDKLCSFAALEALIESCSGPDQPTGGIMRVAAVFDDEEIGSLLRQGARSNFLSSVINRACESLDGLHGGKYGPSILAQTFANSFLVSADVTHAVNPNFLSTYLENHAPRLNVGVTVCADPNGHMTTDAVSTAILQRVAEKSDCTLQVFQIRNDSRSGGTVGPMLSSSTGIRAIDAGIPQLSMHSIRATTGSLDPGLGVKMFLGFYEHYEAVDKEFTKV